MKSCSCLIIEDSPQQVTLLREYMGQIPFLAAPTVVGSVSEAIGVFHELPHRHELILLDIHLPGPTGLSLLHAYAHLPPVVVMSSAPEFAVDCYDFDVADYLLKPFSFTRFLRAVNRALGERSGGADPVQDSIFLKVGHAMQRFAFEEIDFIQAYGIYCKVVSGGRLTVVNETISALEAALNPARFMRVHKSYIINLGKVFSYSHRTILVGEVEIPLGSAYRDAFRAFIGLDKTQEL